ncbi:hypothetical protein D3C75_870550 [compost metagenome]
MLLGLHSLPLQHIFLGERRQKLLVVHSRSLLVAAFHINLHKAGELHLGAYRPEHGFPCKNVNRHGIHHCGGHLAGNEALPDQLIQPVLVAA